jgi:hypothetical protein
MILGKRGHILRLVPLVLALALVLSACGLSTDTVTTVGGDRITRGELNAAVNDTNASLARLAAQQGSPPQQVSPAEMLQQLIDQRLLEIAARDNKIMVTADDLAAEQERVAEALVANQQQRRDQQLAGIITNATRQIRPTINTYGGAVIPDPELQAVVGEEVARLRNLLAARGTTIAVSSAGIPARAVVDEAIVFRNALAGRGVAVPPQEVEPLISLLLQELDNPLFLGSDADHFQQALAASGASGTIYQQFIRQGVLQEKLRPQWAATPVEAITLQELRTDSREKALEAIQRGRAGTPFAELLRTYQLPGIPPGPNDNTLPTSIVLAFEPQLQAAFQGVEIREGAFSAPIATADNRQFYVYRIARVERRAPTGDEAEPLFQQWLVGLRNKYEVRIADPALQPPPVTR